jgi:hypothetical protein
LTTSAHNSPRERAAAGFRYHPFYCEENAWWLCAEPALGPGPRHVVFITNRRGSCPLAAQRAAPPGELCWWDYHVVVLDGGNRIWDLDTRLGCPVPATAWLRGSFPFAARLPADLAPLFRLVPAHDYRAHFASDRGHMRTATGGWLHPPPPWPPIGAGMRLPDYRRVTADGPGELLDWTAMLGRVGT